MDWPATVLRVNVFPTFFDLLRQGDSPVKAYIEMQRIRYYALARIRAPISRNGCVHANERMCWLRETERLALFRVALLRCVIGYFMQRVKTSLPNDFDIKFAGANEFSIFYSLLLLLRFRFWRGMDSHFFSRRGDVRKKNFVERGPYFLTIR